MRPRHWIVNWFLTGSRVLLGLVFLTAGVSKLLPGFPSLIGPVWLVEKLAPYGLGLYAEFIAISQALVGALLLTRRFATLAAVMVFPILVNILMVTISLRWPGTPYVVGFLLLQNLALLAADFHKLKFLFTEDDVPLRSVPVYRQHLGFDAAIVMLVGMLVGVALWTHKHPGTTATQFLRWTEKILLLLLLLSGPAQAWWLRRRKVYG